METGSIWMIHAKWMAVKERLAVKNFLAELHYWLCLETSLFCLV